MPRSTKPLAATKTRRKSKRLSTTGSSSKSTNSDNSTSSSNNSSCPSSPESKPVRKTRSSKVAEALESSSNDAQKSSASPSSSSSSSTTSSNHLPLNKDGPYRRLRTRKSAKNNDGDDDRKQRKRAALAAATADTSSRTNQRKKTRLVVQTKPSLSSSSSSSDEENEDPAVLQQSNLLRGNKKLQATQVTPSPAANTNNNNKKGSAFEFQTPQHRRRLPSSSLPFTTTTTTTRNNLPNGVLDLYPPKKASSETQPIPFGQNDCSSDSLTASFIQSYGQEYWNILKSTEVPTIADPFPPSPLSSPASSSSQSSNSEARSTATPDQNRDFVYVDMSCNMEVNQPQESNVYLAYQPELSPKMRAILVDWIIELSEHFHFGPNSLHLAITLVDKVMACGPLTKLYEDEEDSGEDEYSDEESKTNCFFISRDRFQLLGAACTWLACKMEELSPPSVSEIAYVSDNIYSTEQIKRMERRICNALQFSLSHKTPYLFTTEFIRASYESPECNMAKASPVFYHMVLYLLELCRLPYHPVTQKPSLLAAAAVYAARVTLGVQSKDLSLCKEGRWSRTLQHYTGYSKEDLKETVLQLHSYHQAAEDSSLKSVFAKYRNKKYLRVALKTVPRVQDLGF